LDFERTEDEQDHITVARMKKTHLKALIAVSPITSNYSLIMMALVHESIPALTSNHLFITV